MHRGGSVFSDVAPRPMTPCPPNEEEGAEQREIAAFIATWVYIAISVGGTIYRHTLTIVWSISTILRENGTSDTRRKKTRLEKEKIQGLGVSLMSLNRSESMRPVIDLDSRSKTTLPLATRQPNPFARKNGCRTRETNSMGM